MAWYWVQLWRLISGPPCSEPSIAGESGAQRRRCLSAASSAPSPDSPRSAGHRCAAPARILAACFFGYFLCTSKESDTSPQARKRSAGQGPALPTRGRANKNARREARRSCTALQAEAYATVDARSAAMRSSSGGWLMNSFFAVEPAIPNAAICVGRVLWPWLSCSRSSAEIIF